MTESRRPFDAVQPEPIDDNEDRMGTMRELDFDEEPGETIGDLVPEHQREQPTPSKHLRESGMHENSTDDDESDDDLSPGNLIREDGARDAHEAGEDFSADWDLSIVDENEIGGGNGLDEAEMAERDPVDGNR
ncbi:serine kinase/phosphatase [Pseudomonas purpurea]|uniref:serine kinase/phosphatase n=1 Tax=Pseudomonas purpurea TaxID=3136737 RepID=UPI0032630C63